jgi:3-oxoacyl-[acyl-carrier protein] reductase
VSAEIAGLGGQAITIQADVSIAQEVARMVQQATDAFGPVAVLVDDAGIARPQPLDQITERDWDEVLTVSLKSVFLVTQAVLPKMRAARWGRCGGLSPAACGRLRRIMLHCSVLQ